MLFNVWTLFLFAAVFGIYFYLPGPRWKRYVLLAGSLILYGTWCRSFTFLLPAIGAVAWYGGILLEKNAGASSRKKKWILAALIAVILAPLLLSKYSLFALRIIGHCIRLAHFPVPEPALPGKWFSPPGISFFSFCAIGYLMEVYRRKYPGERNFVTVMLFICFFPTVLAGPINRARDLMPQLRAPQRASWEQAERGIALLLWGLFLKMVLADHLSGVVVNAYAHRADFCGVSVFLAMILYSIQILCDFSGYSYVAIGSASLLGFSVMDNFRHPYFAQGLADFWHRWHVSLSLWLRDYVYVSLGGNRCSVFRKYGNVLITFLISGLWHGANWNFIFWGALHGMGQILDSLIRSAFQKMRWDEWGKRKKIPFQILAAGFTFLFVSYCWVFFANGEFSTACHIIKRSCSINAGDLFSQRCLHELGGSSFVILAVFAVLESIGHFKPGLFYKLPKYMRMISYWLLFAVILFAGKYGPESNVQEFIYFQF